MEEPTPATPKGRATAATTEAFSNEVVVESLLPPEVLELLDLRRDGLLGRLELLLVLLACLLTQGLDLFLLELDRLLVDGDDP